jgi:hypothetical protein
LSITLFVFALLAACQVSQFLLTSDWNRLGLIIICIGGLAFAIRILNNWRQGLYIFFGWLFFEDSRVNTSATTWPFILPRISWSYW